MESSSDLSQQSPELPQKPDTERTLISQIKDHVVQVEAMIIYLLICITVLFIANYLNAIGELQIPYWLIPCLILVGIRLVMQVNNPTAPTRKRLTWAAALGGFFGAIGGAVTDVLTGGLTAGQGTLIGIAAGTAVGGALGNKIESWGAKNELMERGSAFEYLFRHRKKNPKVANAALVDEALKQIRGFDINQDGRKWYALSDLEDFLKKT